MKQTKPYLLLVVSVLLLMSIGLLSVAIYTYMNDPAVQASQSKPVAAPHPLAATRDSLRNIYNETIREIHQEVNRNNGFSQTGFDSGRMEQIQSEMNNLFRNDASLAEVEQARIKIADLQQELDGLKQLNNQMLQENLRLNALVQKLSASQKPAVEKGGVSTQAIPVSTTAPLMLKAQQMQLAAWRSTDFTDKETQFAAETDKLSGSFIIRNPGNQAHVTEMMIVIIKPDGKVLQGSAWDTGIFYSKEGKKLYSTKLRFDLQPAEQKKLQFSLPGENFPAGQYLFQIYYNGQLIGQISRLLT